MRRRAPRSTLFPYTTLFRSEEAVGRVTHAVARRVRDRGLRDVDAESEHRAHATAVHAVPAGVRSEEHTSELQSLTNLVCRLLLEKKKTKASQLKALVRTQ